MSPAPKTAERGLVVGSRYRLESVLGEGGMAVVWSAVHTETDRKVALKLVRADFVTDERVRELFVQEARVAARIGSNDHIVDVLDAGVDPTLGVPFIAMELLAGNTLETRLKKGGLSRVMAADLLDQLADGLEQAHGAGVFHRDLKPANLFLTADRKGAAKLKILDFGIAKLSEQTQKSTHVGTPAYSAPEQLGESWRAIAARSGKVIATQVSIATDVWALGLIAFEMLTGAAPGVFWAATTLAELPVKIVLEPLPVAASRADASLIPPGFDAWLARCLDLDARNRWPTARAAVDALAPSLRGSAPMRVASPTGPPAAAPVIPRQIPAGPPGDPQLAHWAAHHRAEIRAPGDPRPFAWPVIYMPRVSQVPRVALVPSTKGSLVVAEALSSDALRQAVGEDRLLVSLLQTPRFRYRAAIRSKRASGMIDGMARGFKALDALISPNQGGMLRDPQFEQHYEVWAPTPQEAHAAIPIPLRQLLITAGFHGTLEMFNGAVMVTLFDAPRFEPFMLDRLLDVTRRITGLFV